MFAVSSKKHDAGIFHDFLREVRASYDSTQAAKLAAELLSTANSGGKVSDILDAYR